MSKKTSTTSGKDKSKQMDALKAADKSKIKSKKKNRWGESGNVFFTLFGAVAIVGVLGAGIMSTMRGPLSTMVEVNRREQAKSELRVAASLILANSDDDSLEVTCAGEAAGDGYTEGPAPTGTGPTGGGILPSVGASQNDPWGNAYGYCAWNHGDAAVAANTAACGTVLGGTTDTNNIAIAVMSAGPDGVFQTSCYGHGLNGGNDYVDPDGGAGDDIVEAMTYNQAISGSGGLWTPSGATTATIDRDIDLTAGTANLGGASPQLRLGAASMLLPTDDTAGTGDGDCSAANNLILRVNDDPSPPILEICDGANDVWESVAAGANLWTSVDANSIYFQGGTPASTAVGINVVAPDDTLDVGGTIQATGAVDFDSTLNVDGNTTLRGTADVTGNFNVNTNQFTVNATNGNILVAGTSTLNNNVTITATTNDGSSDPLTINDSTPSSIFIVSSDGEVDATGYINTADAYLIDAVTMLSNALGTDGTVLLGQAAGPSVTGNDNTILGANAAATLTTGTNNIVIGHNADVPLPATSNYLNIGGAITGDLSTNDVTITNDLDVTGDLTVSGDDIVMGTNTDTALLIADGTNFNPVVPSGDISVTNAGVFTLDDDTVSVAELDTGAASDGYCLKANGTTALKWEACAGGGGGDGVGTDGFIDLSDTPSSYAGAAADANKVVVVNGAGDGLVFVDADSLDSAGKWADADEANDIKYNVDADNDVLIGADSSVAVSLNANASQDLHVAGIIQTASRIYNAAGAEATPSYSFTSDPDSGIYSGGADILGLVTGGTSRINLLANGDVGVGTASVATGVGGDAQNLLMEVNGPLGATNYCDVDGEDCFVASDVGTGIWTPDGTNDYIEYDDTLGGVRIGKITGQPAPATDWTLDVGNSIVYTSNGVAIGSDTLSTGDVTLDVDIAGNLGAANYCDADGDDCFTAAQFAALAGGAETNDLEGQGAANIANTEIFIGTGAGTGNFAAMSGDVTMANTGATTIAAGAIDPAMLSAVGAAGAGQDEFCLTYEHGSTEFEWVSCASAAGSIAIDDLTDSTNTADNLFIGFAAGALDLGDTYNTSVGINALNSIAAGDFQGASGNTAIGYDALTANASGDSNVAIGTFTLDAVVSSDNNTAIGTQALSAATGGNNTALGAFAGDNIVAGTDNIMIGYNVDASGAAATSELNIGNLIYGDLANNEIFLDAPAAAPADGDFSNGQYSVWIDAANDEIEFKGKDSAGDIINVTVGGGGGGTPGGADTQVQYNDGGAFAGDAGFVYAAASDTLTIGSTINVGDLVNIGATTGAAAPTGVSVSTTIAADAIEESMLKAVDAPADEECLTYEETVGDFEWQACGGGGADRIQDTDNDTYISVDNGANDNIIRFVKAGYGQLMSIGEGAGDKIFMSSVGKDLFEVEAATNNASSHVAMVSDLNSSDSNDRYTFLTRSDSGGTPDITFYVTPGGQAFVENSLGIGTTTPAKNTHFYNSAGESVLFLEGTEATNTGLVLATSGDGASFGDGDTTHWNFTARGDNHPTAAQREDLLVEYWNGATWSTIMYAEHDTGHIGFGGNETPNVEIDVTGDIEYTGTITDVSDRRLKENISPLSTRGSMIEKIASVDTYSFSMKDDANKRIEFGVMAQELEEIFPELVHTANDEMKSKSVNYIGLIAPMIEATKAVHAENMALKAELEDIKSQVELLNKATAGNADKASIIPTNANGWLYALLGMLGTLCIVLVMNRKPSKAE